MGFEPTTPSLGSWYSTTELRPRCGMFDSKGSGLYLSKLCRVKNYCACIINSHVSGLPV